MPNKYRLVRRRNFWLQLSPADRSALTRAGSVRNVGTGEVVFSADDPFSIVSSGWVRLQVNTDAHQASIIDVVGEGDLISALHAYDPITPPWLGETGTMQGVMVRRGKILAVRRETVPEILEKRPSIRDAILRNVIDRYHLAMQFQAARALDVNVRLAQLLLTVLHRFGERYAGENEGYTLAPPLSQGDLASWVAASPTSVARVLRQWRNDRIVQTGHALIRILDVKRLSIEAEGSNFSHRKPPVWG